MTDSLTKARRSWNMSRIRSKDTNPELKVRSKLHRYGLRFRLHARELPGHPDIIFPKYRTAVFVHGCFWHRHAHCTFAYTPKSRVEFWSKKFETNVENDRRAITELRKRGWKVYVIWECEVNREKTLKSLAKKIIRKDPLSPGTKRRS